MAIKTIAELKALWITGYKPIQQDYADLFDSYFSIAGHVLDITYADLYTKTVNAQLTPGQWYRVTDYKSVNFLNGWANANIVTAPSPGFDPMEIHTGDVEPILIQAISTYEIAEAGYSQSFQGDVIQYQPYTNKIGVNFQIYNGYTLPDGSLVGGFDLQWDGTNVYFNMPTGYPALFGHYFYLSCAFTSPTYGRVDGASIMSGVAAGLTATTYNNVRPTSLTGTGSETTLTIIDNGDTTYTVSTLNKGLNYSVGDILFILGSKVGGVDGVNDVTLVVNSINGNYYQDGNFEPLTPVIANCQYPYTSNDVDYNYFKKMSRISVSSSGMRVVLLDLDHTDFNNYLSGSLYAQTVYSIGDAYGWITKRNDTLRNIVAPLDFRGRKYRRFEADIDGSVNTFSYGALPTSLTDGVYSNVNAVEVGPTTGYSLSFNVNVSGGAPISIILCNHGKNYRIGDTFLIYGNLIGGVYGVDDITITVSSVNNKIGYYQIKPDYYSTGNYKDFKVFSNDGFDANNIEWNDTGGADLGWYTGRNDNALFLGHFYDNKINGAYYNNTVGGTFSYNVISGGFNNNIVGAEFSVNIVTCNFIDNIIVGYFSNNTVKSSFSYNIISNGFSNNDIGDGFSSNTIRDYFYNNVIGNNFNGNLLGDSFNFNNVGHFVSDNIIGNYFYYNTITNRFYSNVIGEHFQYNEIKDYFNGNKIRNYFKVNSTVDHFTNNIIADFFQKNIVDSSLSSTDFLSAIYVYGDYNCNIFKASDGSLYLSYFDGTLIQHTAPNA